VYVAACTCVVGIWDPAQVWSAFEKLYMDLSAE
jgi:hypothetical protein